MRLQAPVPAPVSPPTLLPKHKFKDMVTKNLLRGLPWQSRAKTSPSNAGDVGSLPGLEAKIPPASTAKKKKSKYKIEIVL